MLCVRAVIACVSVGLLGLGRSFFIIGGVGRSFLRIRGVLLWSIVGITANREWNVNMADKREGKQNLIVPSPIWYGILPLYRKLYPAISPRRRRMAPSSRSRTIYVGNGSLTLRRTRTCTNYIHPQSPHKSFAELFQKRPFPPFPQTISRSLSP